MDTFLGLVAFSLIFLWFVFLMLHSNEEARKKHLHALYKTQTDKQVKRTLLGSLFLIPWFIFLVLDSPSTELDKCIRANLDRDMANPRFICHSQGIY
tara:strand:+ start:91 stop:381 length:291 start_codon:yes stop_codon:yes gene_type:complete